MHIYLIIDYWILLSRNKAKPEQIQPLTSKTSTQANQLPQLSKHFGKTFPHFTRFSFTPPLHVPLISPKAPCYEAGYTQSFKQGGKGGSRDLPWSVHSSFSLLPLLHHTFIGSAIVS